MVRVGLRGGRGQQGTEDGVSEEVFSALLGFLKVKSTPFQRWYDPPGSLSALLISFCPLKIPLVLPLVIATLRLGSHCEVPAEAALDCDSKAGLFSVAGAPTPQTANFLKNQSPPHLFLSLPLSSSQSSVCSSKAAACFTQALIMNFVHLLCVKVSCKEPGLLK